MSAPRVPPPPAAPPASPDTDESYDSDDFEEPSCTACLARPRDTVFSKCGHFTLCNACAKERTDCPVCHKPRGPLGLIKMFGGRS